MKFMKNDCIRLFNHLICSVELQFGKLDSMSEERMNRRKLKLEI